jgi:adenylate kinase
MLTGVLLEDDEIYSLIKEAIDRVTDQKKCLLDGTPRSIPQAQWLMQQVERGSLTIDAVLHLEVNEAVVRGRLLSRGRPDDTEEGITKRFEEYRRATLPIVEYFKQKKVPVFPINADQPAEAVHHDIVEVLTTKE